MTTDLFNEQSWESFNVWKATLPPSVLPLIAKLPPNKVYKFINSGKHCYMISYEENGTVTVEKTGHGGGLAQISKGLALAIDTNQVFGVSPDDLIEISEEEFIKEYKPEKIPPKL